ncbi:MAG: hypothetical protein ABSE18_03540 [Minisyncoccia bacterium]
MVKPTIKKAGLFGLIVLMGLVVFVTASHVKLAFFGKTLLAQVGVSVGVLPNPYNTLNDALSQKAAYLNAQEAALASTTAAASSPAGDSSLGYLTVAVAVLAVLVALNFYLDWRRFHKKTGDPDLPSAPAIHS